MHAFDTLAFAQKLKAAGYSETQAEALAEAQGEVFREMLNSTLATKDDLRELATKDDLRQLDQKLESFDRKLESFDQRLESFDRKLGGFATKDDLRQLDHRLESFDQKLEGFATKDALRELDQRIDGVVNQMTVRLGGMIAVGIGLLAAMRFFG